MPNNRGGKRPNAGRKPAKNPKKFKTFSVLESDFYTFSTIAKNYGVSNNRLFTLFLGEYLDVLKEKLDKSNN